MSGRDKGDLQELLVVRKEEQDTPIVNEGVTVKEILMQAACIGASYTGSFSFIVIAILAGHIQNQNDDTNYLGATTLITSTLYPTTVIGASTIFSVLYYVMEKLPQWDDPNNSEDQKARHKKDIERLPKNIFLFSLISLPAWTAITVYFSSAWIMRSLFSQNKQDVDLAQQYLSIAVWTTLPLSMRLGFEQILFPFNKQFQVMCIALATFSLGVMLAALFCYTLDLKLTGIAIAFLIEAFVTQFAFGFYLNRDKDLKSFRFFDRLAYDSEDLRQIWQLNRLGAPIAASISADIIAFSLMNEFAGWVSSDALAAQDIASQVFFFTFIPSFAIAQVVAIKTGGAIGAKKYEAAVESVKKGLLAVSLVLGVCTVPLLVYPGLMRAIVTSDSTQHVAELSDSAVRFAAVTSFVMAISNVLLQTVRCADAMDFLPTYLSIGGAFLGVALSYLLGFQAKWGLDGVVGGYGAGIAVGTAGLFALSARRLTVESLKRRELAQQQVSDQTLDVGKPSV